MGCASTIPHQHGQPNTNEIAQAAKSVANAKKSGRRDSNGAALVKAPPPLTSPTNGTGSENDVMNAATTASSSNVNNSLSELRNKSQSAGTIITIANNHNTVIIAMPQLENTNSVGSPASQRYKVQSGGLVDEDELLNSSRRSVHFGDSPGAGPASPSLFFTSPTGAGGNRRSSRQAASPQRRSSQQPSPKPQFPRLQPEGNAAEEESTSDFFDGFFSGDADNDLAPYDLDSDGGNAKHVGLTEEEAGYLNQHDIKQVKRINSQRKKQCTLSSDPQTLDHYRKGTFNIPDDDAYFDASRVVVINSAKSSLADFNSVAGSFGNNNANNESAMGGSIRSSSTSTMSVSHSGLIKSALRQSRQTSSANIAIVVGKRTVPKPRTKTVSGGDGLFDYSAFAEAGGESSGMYVADNDADASTFDALALPIVARLPTGATGNPASNGATSFSARGNTTTASDRELSSPHSPKQASNDNTSYEKKEEDQAHPNLGVALDATARPPAREGESLSASISSPTARRLLRIQTTFLEANPPEDKRKGAPAKASPPSSMDASNSPPPVHDAVLASAGDDSSPINPSQHKTAHGRGNHFSGVPQTPPMFRALGAAASSVSSNPFATSTPNQQNPQDPSMLHRHSLTNSHGGPSDSKGAPIRSNISNSGLFGESSMRSNSLVSAADLPPLQFAVDGEGNRRKSTEGDTLKESSRRHSQQSSTNNFTPNQQTNNLPVTQSTTGISEDRLRELNISTAPANAGIILSPTMPTALPISSRGSGASSPNVKNAPSFLSSSGKHTSQEQSPANVSLAHGSTTPRANLLPPIRPLQKD
eukprot:GILI01004159.1.p1 GENE.GILI01004159.1~~GILI01004159.1.p1  ORF type:complete len:817 (+),score=147.16 GILI01004159.1:361-2811(+)